MYSASFPQSQFTPSGVADAEARDSALLDQGACRDEVKWEHASLISCMGRDINAVINFENITHT